MHYFLADDTIELRALHGPNSGRDPVSVMVKRGSVPKSYTGGPASETFHWRDFDIGVEVGLITEPGVVFQKRIDMTEEPCPSALVR